MKNTLLLQVSIALLGLAQATAFPSYTSLAGLSHRELDAIMPTLQRRQAPSPPGPLHDTSAKLVNDEAHPWQLLQTGDIRGPCPGLNTLASHGYLPRNGIVSPSQIINAVQEGLHLVDGNVVTDQLSIGGKSPLTGPGPTPATVAGLNTHAVFEGDSSMTRGDFFFGNNHDFNESLFDQFVDYSNRYGSGKYNLTVAGELRRQRIQQSIANFSFVSPRFLTAYAESVFPINFFVDGRQDGGQLDTTVARGFFQNNSFPEGFFRPNGSRGADGIDAVLVAHPIQAGGNVGKVNSYTPDPTSADFSNVCLFYENFVNKTIKGLYPDPTGDLRDALNTNLNYFYQALGGGCTQVFPYEH